MVMINIYLTCKQYDQALAEIEELLSLETEYTVNDFNLMRAVDPIRNDPRFIELMQRYKLDIASNSQSY